MKRASVITLMLIGAYSAIQAAWAVDYPLPQANSRLVGQNQTYTIQEGDNKLQTIARRFNTAAQLILETNNTIAPVDPAPGTTIIIPSQMLLPDTPREGIVVNLAELRLYYFPPGEKIVQVFPLGIGKQGLETPVTITHVSQKIPNPTWTPTPASTWRKRCATFCRPQATRRSWSRTTRPKLWRLPTTLAACPAGNCSIGTAPAHFGSGWAKNKNKKKSC